MSLLDFSPRILLGTFSILLLLTLSCFQTFNFEHPSVLLFCLLLVFVTKSTVSHKNTKYPVEVDEWVNWMMCVTFRYISVIHVTAHRYVVEQKKKLDLPSGYHAIDISCCFSVLLKASTQGHNWFGYYQKQPLFVAFYNENGDTEDLFSS